MRNVCSMSLGCPHSAATEPASEEPNMVDGLVGKSGKCKPYWLLDWQRKNEIAICTGETGAVHLHRGEGAVLACTDRSCRISGV